MKRGRNQDRPLCLQKTNSVNLNNLEKQNLLIRDVRKIIACVFVHVFV